MEEIELYTSNYTYDDSNDTLYEYEEECPEISMLTINTIFSVLYSLICAIGLIGNGLVIYVVLRYSTMQTVTNTYIFNLAVADSCFLISIPFLVITIKFRSWLFGYFMCKAYMMSTGVNQFTSSIFIFIMSADRYVAICHPKAAHRLRTPLAARIVSAVAWTISALMMLPILMFTTLLTVENIVSCNIVWPTKNNFGGHKSFILYNSILSFAGPLTLTSVFYCLIIIKLKTYGSNLPSVEKTRSRRKVTKLVLAIISVYMLCWLPYWVMQITLSYSQFGKCTQHVTTILFLIVSSLCYSNSALNPILYAFLSDSFRKSFMEACSCFNKNSTSTNTTSKNNEMIKTETMTLETIVKGRQCGMGLITSSVSSKP